MFLVQLFAFWFGSICGSFLNVVIYRLPRSENVVFPGSRCPECKTKIPWYHLFPIFSWMILKGKCFKCKKRISWEYPLIEIICAVVAVLLLPKHPHLGNLGIYIFYFTTFCALLAHFVIDLKHQILPDGINLYLGILFSIYSLISYGPIHMILGGLVGLGFPYAVTWIFYKFSGKVGLGGGDIKLFAALGILLGIKGILFNIFFSCALGSVIGIILISLKILQRNRPFAFGPFIIVVAGGQIFLPDLIRPIEQFYFGFL